MPQKAGAKIVCEDGSNQVIWNGVDGSQGTPGTPGNNGNPGKDGKTLCGITEYDPAENFCYGITLYELCGGAVYEPATHFCGSDDRVLENAVERLLTSPRNFAMKP